MIDNKDLLPVDDRVMAKLVDFKTVNGYYPTFKELREYARMQLKMLQQSLRRLSKLNKVNLVIINDKHNPLITE